MTLIDKAYQLYDGLGDKVAEVFGEDGRKHSMIFPLP